MALYNNSFRFGLSAEGGAKLYLIENLSVEATYERSLMYPRLLFWRTAGSLLAEGIGHWLVDEFMLRVKNNSPFVVPILNFLLQNGVSYAVYELRKDEMNFPFGGNTPLMQETFKFGVTFIF